MTEKIFWSDPYRTRHETVVASVNGPDITLESTIFFAFSGGQESDHGTLQGIPVVSARKEGLLPVYTMPQEHNLSAGQKVVVEPKFTEKANRIISSDREILTGFDDEANERRYWQIEGLARVACGGTHVKRTGEIGPIRLKRDNIGKGKERVEIYLQE